MYRFGKILILALMIAPACARDGTLGPGSETDGLTQVFLTDAPFPYDRISRVDVFVASVAATAVADTLNQNREGVTVAEPGHTFNLLDLQGGTTAFMGESALAAGVYHAIRVVIDASRSSVTLDDGSEAAVDWQGNGEKALYAVVEDPLDVPNQGASIVIDFDVGRSFLPVGGGFVFLPWLRAVNEAATGSLGGSLQGRDGSDGLLVPVPNASISVFAHGFAPYDGSTPTATAHTDSDGQFFLPFLLGGSYTVQVTPPAGFDAGAATETGVSVTVGSDRTIGITLPAAPDPSSITGLSIQGKRAIELGDSVPFSAYLFESVGDSVPATQAVWQTSSSAIATITGSGQSVTVNGAGAGLALITVSCLGKTESLLVNVGGVAASVESIELTPATQTLGIGDSTSVQAILRDENGEILLGQGVTWSLSDASVVSIMEGFSGDFAIFRGLKVGTVTVSAAADGKSGSAVIVVN